LLSQLFSHRHRAYLRTSSHLARNELAPSTTSTKITENSDKLVSRFVQTPPSQNRPFHNWLIFFNNPKRCSLSGGISYALSESPEIFDLYFCFRGQPDRLRPQVRDRERGRARLEVHQRERDTAIAEAHTGQILKHFEFKKLDRFRTEERLLLIKNEPIFRIHISKSLLISLFSL